MITDQIIKLDKVTMMTLVADGILCDWHVKLTPDGIRVRKLEFTNGDEDYVIFMAPQQYVTQNKNDSWKMRSSVMKFRTTRDMIVRMISQGILPPHKNHVLEVDFLLGQDMATKANFKSISNMSNTSTALFFVLDGKRHEFHMTSTLHQKPDGDNLLKGFKDCILPEKRVHSKLDNSGIFDNIDDSKVSVHRTRRLITTLPGSLIFYRPFAKE